MLLCSNSFCTTFMEAIRYYYCSEFIVTVYTCMQPYYTLLLIHLHKASSSLKKYNSFEDQKEN